MCEIGFMVAGDGARHVVQRGRIRAAYLRTLMTSAAGTSTLARRASSDPRLQGRSIISRRSYGLRLVGKYHHVGSQPPYALPWSRPNPRNPRVRRTLYGSLSLAAMIGATLQRFLGADDCGAEMLMALRSLECCMEAFYTMHG